MSSGRFSHTLAYAEATAALVLSLGSTRGNRTRDDMSLRKLRAYFTGVGLVSDESASVNFMKSTARRGPERSGRARRPRTCCGTAPARCWTSPKYSHHRLER